MCGALKIDHRTPRLITAPIDWTTSSTRSSIGRPPLVYPPQPDCKPSCFEFRRLSVYPPSPDNPSQVLVIGKLGKTWVISHALSISKSREFLLSP